ncbi:AraC family transcriptional regulator [Cellulophaga sp. F20128]|nr:AraC family transcriptional regulator [Cellulophaga sp. F20128]
MDSIDENIKNVQGKYFAFSNFIGSGKSYNQGKLVSRSFVIKRDFIHLLIAGGHHETRECVNLIVNNKVVRVATGSNDNVLRKISWDVSDMQGQNAVLEIVDAMATEYERNSLAYIIVDNILFSDYNFTKEEVFENFESGTYNNWKVEGDAFEVPRDRTNIYYPITANGFKGKYFAFSFGETHDTKQGKLTSSPFKIKYDRIKFLIGGGNHQEKTCVNLIVNDSVVFSEVGQNDGQMRWHHWNVDPFVGSIAKIEIVDHHSGDWGHVMVDDIIFYNKPIDFRLLYYLGIGVFFLGVIFYLNKRSKFKWKSNSKFNGSEEELEKFNTLKEYIENSKIYIEQNLSIHEIVKNSGISEVDINLLFENVGNTSLSNYINFLRVEEFKRQLKDPANAAYTMMYLAEKSGFNSKTSFYRVFKSVTKRTPSEYKKSLHQNH